MKKYRPEIDGLRAVAVLPVIFFHAGFEIFKGGFIGVDVFFVISGYLITTILLNDLSNNEFSLFKFYARRAKRILPALFFMIIVCIPFSWIWMLPDQLKNFSNSVIAVALFVSNILFWRQSGYFTSEAELNPLLHTWSLAVEEQYYLFFPVILLFFRTKHRKKLFWFITAIALCSFLVAEWGWRHKPIANFYLSPSRFWELLLGSMVAIYLENNVIKQNNLLSLMGFIFICVAIFLLDSSTPFPSFYTLIPVLGTVLIIIYAGEKTLTNKILTFKPLVFVGLISYSAYLWHQPLFSFARIISFDPPSHAMMLFLASLTMVIAYISWRFIEKPFREQRIAIFSNQNRVLLSSVFVGMFFVCLGIFGSFKDGFPDRSINQTKTSNLTSRFEPNYGLANDCGSSTVNLACQTSTEPKILLWGDSYAMQLANGLVSSNPDISLIQKTFSSCAPIIGIAQINNSMPKSWAEKCIEFNQEVYEKILSERYDLIIISSPFSAIFRDKILTAEGYTKDYSSPEIADLIKDSFSNVTASGSKLVIVAPTPKSGNDLGLCLMREAFFRQSNDMCNFTLNLETKAFEFLNNIEHEFPVYWLHNDICKNGICYPKIDNIFIYRDGGHLSVEGSNYLGSKFNWITRMSILASSY